MSCREEDLAEPDAPRRPIRERASHRDAGPAARDEYAAPPGRIDLHGLTVDEAVEQVTREIDMALRRGADRIEVVHGKGSGRVRTAVHRLLATFPVVSRFRLDPRNPGVTWVWLR